MSLLAIKAKKRGKKATFFAFISPRGNPRLPKYEKTATDPNGMLEAAVWGGEVTASVSERVKDIDYQ